MPTISKEIKIALLGICALALFVIGYNYLKGSNVFSSSKILYAEYDNVQGLAPAGFVQWQGLNIGNVKSIELSKKNPGKILVAISVDKDMQIPEDSKAAIESADLLGTKIISIKKGTSANQAKANQMLQGDITTGMIDNIGASAGPAIDNAKNAIADLNVTIKSINNILDTKSQSNLKNTLADMSKTMKDFSQFANELNAQRAKISSLINNLNSFSSNLEKNNGTVTRVLNNAEATTANLKNLDFNSTLQELKGTMSQMQTTISKLNTGNGSMALLMNDDKLYRNLKNTLATANNLLADVNARPSRYINVAIFGRKNKNDCPPQPAPNSNE